MLFEISHWQNFIVVSADTFIVKADFLCGAKGPLISKVENIFGSHQISDSIEIWALILCPFCDEHQCIGVLDGVVGGINVAEIFFATDFSAKISLTLWVVGHHFRASVEQHVDDG